MPRRIEMKSPTFNFRIDPQWKAKLEDLAFRKGISTAELVRRMIACGLGQAVIPRHYDPINAMSDWTDLAWAAGFIDGEGSIFITRVDPSPKNRQATPNFIPNISAVNNETNPLLKLKDMFGGYITPKPQHKFNGYDCQGGYMWRVAGAKAVRVTQLIEPYLVIKRRKAQLVIELYKLGNHHNGRKRVPQTVIEERNRLREEVNCHYNH